MTRGAWVLCLVVACQVSDPVARPVTSALETDAGTHDAGVVSEPTLRLVECLTCTLECVLVTDQGVMLADSCLRACLSPCEGT